MGNRCGWRCHKGPPCRSVNQSQTVQAELIQPNKGHSLQITAAFPWAWCSGRMSAHRPTGLSLPPQPSRPLHLLEELHKHPSEITSPTKTANGSASLIPTSHKPGQREGQTCSFTGRYPHLPPPPRDITLCFLPVNKRLGNQQQKHRVVVQAWVKGRVLHMWHNWNQSLTN